MATQAIKESSRLFMKRMAFGCDSRTHGDLKQYGVVSIRVDDGTQGHELHSDE